MQFVPAHLSIVLYCLKHSAQVNQISVDLEGEILASCSDDGKACLIYCTFYLTGGHCNWCNHIQCIFDLSTAQIVH